MKTFNKRVWLNRPDSPSTGSIVVFDGEIQWRSDRPIERESWLEVADCHCKVRLHRCYEDTQSDFLKKVETMRDVLDEYINHLKIKLDLEVKKD